MPYLIDGHNLIGQLSTIRLDDPDDEAKLVMLLQRFSMRRKVKVAVVFDRGHFGQQTLGGNGVGVRFARSPSDADAIIKSQLRRLISPREWTVVSSDREIVAVAQEVRARVMSAQEFAQILIAMDTPAPFDAERAAAHAHVRGDKVDEWLEVFGVDEDEASKAIDLQQKPRPAPEADAKRRPAATKVIPRTPPERWPAPKPKPHPDPVPREADGRPRRSRGGPKPISSAGEPLFKPPPPVHPDEIDEWLEFFGSDQD